MIGLLASLHESCHKPIGHWVDRFLRIISLSRGWISKAGLVVLGLNGKDEPRRLFRREFIENIFAYLNIFYWIVK